MVDTDLLLYEVQLPQINPKYGGTVYMYTYISMRVTTGGITRNVQCRGFPSTVCTKCKQSGAVEGLIG